MAIEREYKVESSSRRCSGCERAFGVGDEYYSAVVETDQENFLARRDFCPACWERRKGGAVLPGEGERPLLFFSFWKTRIPEPKDQGRGPRLIDLERLLALFERLGESQDPGAQRFRYVLALALMRKRRLRLVSSRRLGGPSATLGTALSPSKGGKRGEEMVLREVGSEKTHVVLSPGLSADEMISVAGRLQEILDMPERWEQADEVGPEES